MTLPRSILLLAAALLAGCNARTETPPVAVALAQPAPAAEPPQGSGCGPAIARTRAIVDSDVATGNIDAPVGARFRADLDQADRTCAGGRAPEALRQLAAAKVRYGYR